MVLYVMLMYSYVELGNYPDHWKVMVNARDGEENKKWLSVALVNMGLE